VDSRDRERGLQLLRELANTCVRCPLSTTRARVVFGEGPADAPLLIPGEGPGEDEDVAGRPFVGDAGRRLDGMLRAVGLRREAVYIANVAMCHPPGRGESPNRPPTKPEADACAPYLDLVLAAVRPAVILADGETATRRLLGPIRTLGDVRGVEHEAGDWVVIPTWHPSGWHYQPGRSMEAQADLRRAWLVASARRTLVS